MGANTGDEAATGIAIPDAYKDAQRLGSGAEGGTWLATDRGSERRVVLKRVPAARVPIVRRAFDLLRTVGSPHLPAPRALTVDADDPGARWLATDYVEGAPLSLEATGRVAALREALAVAHALAAIHRTGTHHGDVAPGNVIVTGTGGVILVDLGQLGQRGTGTPGFIAPEVLAGGGGPAADRFALGSLLCLRLFGAVPWRRPDALVAVRTDADVRRRLQELTADRPTPKGVLALLELLLHPDPARRIGAADLLVARLGGLVRAAEAGVDLPARATWWLPQRWPYRAGPGGADVEALATRLAAGAPIRLVAVAGPMGVGRRRVVEELVQQLQSADAGPEAIACEPGALGGVVGRPAATWIEAWLSSAAAGKVLGLTSEPPWPSLGSDAGSDAGQRQARAHAAMLVDGVSSATATLVVPVGQRLARALEQHPASQQGAIAVVRVRPWDPNTLGHALDEVLECDDVAAWNRVLLDATGGWPGRVVRAVTACATLDVQSPSPAAVERALESLPGGAVLGLDETTAADVLRAGWCPGDGGLAKLPSHLHDGTAPHASAIAEARRRVGSSGLAPLARSVLGKRRRDARPIGLTLAVDAGAANAIQAALLHDHALPISRAGSGGALRWLLAGGAGRVCDEAVAVACRGLLADGDARRALELAITHPDGPACRLEAARAAQRLGKPTDALEHLDYAIAIATGTDDGRAAAEGLRWRLLVDRGQAEAAAAEARRRLPELAVDGLGGATARLWGAMAALVSGDGETALGWLDEAEAAMRRVASGHGHAALPGSRTAAAEGVLARVCQLRGNVAQGEGDLAAAQRWYGLAAEAFARACEPVGGLMVRGSLAGLAIPTFETTRGIEDGRRALRGLVARGQLSATLEASLNLVQLLTRSGADEQAEAVASLTEALFATRREVDRLVRGRLSRIDAELCVRRRGVRAAEDAFVAAAVDLEAAQGSREAVEAWLCAARCARQEGGWQRAAAHLDRATAIGANDEDSRAMLQLETLALAVSRVPTSASGGIEGAARVALDRGLVAVRGLGDPEALAARGRLDLAWATALGTALALHRRLPVGHPARGKATRRLLDVLERIMNKTEPSDRAAVRASLTADATERAGLRELLSELDGDPLPPAAPQPAPTAPARSVGAEQTGRLSGLIRIYRRLAREDRLEHLLEQVVDAMMELTDAERGAVVVLPLPETVTETATENPEAPDPPRLEVTRELSAAGEGIRFSRSVIERVLSEGEPVLSVDAAHDDRFDGSRSISHLNLRSVLAVPLRFRGEVFGAAYVDHRLRRGAFDEDDLGHMEEFADLAALAVAHARAVAALRSQAEQLEEQRERLAGMLEVREAEVEGLRGRVADGQDDDRHGMVGSSAGMQKVFRLIDRLADSDVPVVIHGESGTGKELVARAIHRGGPRRDGAFIAENCGAIPETLLESVLFGHARGAFTGAAKAKPGLFEAAHGGTIFLDEVGEMSPGMQTKLLRVLQEGEVRRVGENKSRSVDVRVIAASNADLDAMVEAGTFRRDLYYRINVVKLVLPPLREREGDLPALIEHLASRHGVTDLTVSPSALRVLCRHGWPGNVRELENEVQRWIALAEGTVEVEDLSPALVGGVGDPGPDADDLQIRPRVDLLERDLIKRALDRTGNNQTKAAALLGLSRFGLQKKLRRLAEADAEEAAG